jgi:hypothetical protein
MSDPQLTHRRLPDLRLPEALSDVACTVGAVPPNLEGATARGVLWQARPGCLLLDVPNAARYRVEAGHRIVIDPMPEADAERVQRFLCMTPLAALLYQRGVLALHAAAVAGPSGAVLLAGDSGAGKSALLAALVARGWPMLTDDLAMVDFDAAGRLAVWPTFPQMLLWRDTIDHLPLDQVRAESDIDRVDTGQMRYLVHTTRFEAAPQPIRRIYWLTVQAGGPVTTADVQGTALFRVASVLTYNSHIADVLTDRAAHFQRISALAQDIPLRRLRRTRSIWTLDELVEVVVGEAAA